MLTTILLYGLMSTETALGGSTKAAMCKMDNECHVLAEAAYHEARGEGRRGMLGVMHVILNRVDNPQWKNTVREVVYQPYQFSYIKGGALTRGVLEEELWGEVLMLAYDTINGNTESPVGDAVYFYNPKYASPDFASSTKLVAKIGNHVFRK